MSSKSGDLSRSDCCSFSIMTCFIWLNVAYGLMFPSSSDQRDNSYWKWSPCLSSNYYQFVAETLIQPITLHFNFWLHN
jgi:hypothetical protein